MWHYYSGPSMSPQEAAKAGRKQKAATNRAVTRNEMIAAGKADRIARKKAAAKAKQVKAAKARRK